MENDVERFLRVLEAERGFSLNTIFAYRNDLNQFPHLPESWCGERRDGDWRSAVAAGG